MAAESCASGGKCAALRGETGREERSGRVVWLARASLQPVCTRLSAPWSKKLAARARQPAITQQGGTSASPRSPYSNSASSPIESACFPAHLRLRRYRCGARCRWASKQRLRYPSLSEGKGVDPSQARWAGEERRCGTAVRQGAGASAPGSVRHGCAHAGRVDGGGWRGEGDSARPGGACPGEGAELALLRMRSHSRAVARSGCRR